MSTACHCNSNALTQVIIMSYPSTEHKNTPNKIILRGDFAFQIKHRFKNQKYVWNTLNTCLKHEIEKSIFIDSQSETQGG